MSVIESNKHYLAFVRRAVLQSLRGAWTVATLIATHRALLFLSCQQPDGRWAGPGTRRLPYLALSLNSTGQIDIHRSEQVAATFRLAQP